ncbi:MAG TPA: 16S rRNA (cytosine(1402)-N(4))-methyltransferase RsmH [Saprospiraceae bacterium]|nr:16S rRNA (cytosine(1402)-N(4))-methyltransferase RsmH [Saprospiraceae bacterium]
MSLHVPVLLNESLKYLITDKSGIYFDATIGYGGHASEILKRLNSNATLVGTDKDEKAYKHCKEKFKGDSRVKIFNTGFTEIKRVSMIQFINAYDGIFADLGVSSVQLDDNSLGFTYRTDSQLDLRMDKTKGKPASYVINNYPLEKLIEISRNLGELRNAGRIARKIVEVRTHKKINTTLQLRETVETVVPKYKSFKILSQVFQAFRIYVNNELEELKSFLTDAVDMLKPGGRIVVISYHSLEDRIVKETFKYESLSCVCPPEAPICVCDKQQRLKIITKKPVVPGEEEIKNNKRARSAKLRVAEKV